MVDLRKRGKLGDFTQMLLDRLVSVGDVSLVSFSPNRRPRWGVK
jgi:hypothetical protein